MNAFIKNTLLVSVIFYALFATIVTILYIVNFLSQETMMDWMAKGALIAVAVVIFSLIVGLASKQGK